MNMGVCIRCRLCGCHIWMARSRWPQGIKNHFNEDHWQPRQKITPEPLRDHWKWPRP